MKQKTHMAVTGYLMMAPMLILMTVFYFVPIGISSYMSFTNWDLLSIGRFVGLDNYAELFTDKYLPMEIRNTFILSFFSVSISMALSLLLVSAMSTKIRGKSLYRLIYFLPNVTMPAAIALVWQWMLNSKYGIINLLLAKLGIYQPSWLSDPNYILPAIVMVGVWSTLGYNLAILMSGLLTISPSYYEAAEIDGAGGFARFWHITVPLLSPYTFFLTVTSVINTLKAFDVVYIFNSANAVGGPMLDASRTIVFGIYETGFTYNRMGFASAKSLFLLVLIAAITGVQFYMQKRWVNYD